MNDGFKQRGRTRVATMSRAQATPIVIFGAATGAVIISVAGWLISTNTFASGDYYFEELTSKENQPSEYAQDMPLLTPGLSEGSKSSEMRTTTRVQQSQSSESSQGSSKATVTINGKTIKPKANGSVTKTVTNNGNTTTVKINMNSNSSSDKESYLDLDIQSSTETVEGGD